VIGTPSGTVLAFAGNGTSCSPSANGLVALRISGGSPPSVATAWCASVTGRGSPIATTTGGGLESMIWVAGAQLAVAEGDNRLHGVNAETGEPIFTSAQLRTIARWNAPIVAKGRIYIAGVDAAYAFTVR